MFSSDRDTLWTSDKNCFLYEWDLGSGRCIQKHKEPWATEISSLAISNAGPYSTPTLAVGTRTGNVDLFDLSQPHLTADPSWQVDNLTTSADTVRYHPQGEILAVASKWAPDSLRVVHLGSRTVFDNWPTTNTPLQRVTAVDFSRRGGFMAIGNERGRVLLYQLSHYEHQSSQ